MSESDPTLPKGWASRELYDKFKEAYKQYYIKAGYAPENVGQTRQRYRIQSVTGAQICSCCGSAYVEASGIKAYYGDTHKLTYSQMKDGIVPDLGGARDHIVIRDKDVGDYIFTWYTK